MKITLNISDLTVEKFRAINNGGAKRVLNELTDSEVRKIMNKLSKDFEELNEEQLYNIIYYSRDDLIAKYLGFKNFGEIIDRNNEFKRLFGVIK